MSVMSLRPHVLTPVPEETARVACAAFPKGHPSLTLRDALGTIFQDDDFTDRYSHEGQPGLSAWRLALVTIMPVRQTLSDRQAAESVRARIDWKYLLSLDLTDPGFDFSVLSAFRDRLLAGSAVERVLDKLLERCRAMGWLKARGPQRTDSTHVLAAMRVLNRLELVAETVGAGGGPAHRVRFKTNRALPPAAEGIESPDDADARYRHKRDTQWTGYMVHVSETCEPTEPHLLTHVQTTTAAVHEAMCTDDIAQALVEKNLPPHEPLVDAAYLSAALLVKSREAHGMVLRGPTRPSQGWQTQVDGAYTMDPFAIDWDRQEAHCPPGKQAVS